MAVFWQSYGFYLWLLTALGMLGLAGAVVFMARSLRRATNSYQKLTRGVEEAGLDRLIEQRVEQVQAHEETIEQLARRIGQLEQLSVRHVGLIRFNPFSDQGGDQSFAAALLDGDKNGFVLSSIYSRGGTRIYAKAVQAGRSAHHLSDEEIAAINQATGVEPKLAQELKLEH